MTRLFIDTGAWFARYSQNDAHHPRATETWPMLSQFHLYTSSMVMVELARLVQRFRGSEAAAQRVRRIYDSPRLTILRPIRKHELQALDEMERFADTGLGYVDALSFGLMREHGITRAFTFDRHFAIAGFEPWPGP